MRMIRCLLLCAPLVAPGCAAQRMLLGRVTGQTGAPLRGAIVQIENMATFRVRSYITQSDGAYHFPNVQPNVDYEVKAMYKGAHSPAHMLSMFDSHQLIHVDLRIAKPR